jgi:hypothetical protein
MAREIFPARLLYCSGPIMIDAANTLVVARDDALRVLASGKPQ